MVLLMPCGVNDVGRVCRVRTGLAQEDLHEPLKGWSWARRDCQVVIVYSKISPSHEHFELWAATFVVGGILHHAVRAEATSKTRTGAGILPLSSVCVRVIDQMPLPIVGSGGSAVYFGKRNAE